MGGGDSPMISYAYAAEDKGERVVGYDGYAALAEG